MLAGAAAALAGAAVVNAYVARQSERAHPPKGRFLTVDGVQLHYIERGQGRPVVLLHGNGALAEDYELSGVLDLASEKYRVIAFDRPGFGYSERPRGRNWTPTAQAELLSKALLSLGVERPIVVGHSWGTLVAIALALEPKAQVSGLVLLSGYYFPTARKDVYLQSPSAMPVIGDVMRFTVSPLLGWVLIPGIYKQLFSPSAVVPRFATGFPIGLSLRPSQLQAIAADTVLMVPSAAFLQSRYGELSIPVIIMAGTGDKLTNFDRQSSRLHDTIPQSELFAREGGHMIHYLYPNDVITAINLADSRSA